MSIRRSIIVPVLISAGWVVVGLVLASWLVPVISSDRAYHRARYCHAGENGTRCIIRIEGSISSVKEVSDGGESPTSYARITLRTPSNGEVEASLDNSLTGGIPAWLAQGNPASVTYWRGHQMAVFSNGHHHMTRDNPWHPVITRTFLVLVGSSLITGLAWVVLRKAGDR